jgi:preprotein translocase subunit SecD
MIGFILAVVPFPVSGDRTFTGFMGAIKRGIDISGGVYAVYGVSDDETNRDNLDARLDGTASTLRGMLFDAGFMEATVVTTGNQRIRIEVPDIESPEELLRIIGDPATLEFRIAGVARVRGEDVTDAFVINNQGRPAIQIILNSRGAQAFFEATRDNVNSRMDIVVIQGGQERVISSPNIEAAISGGRPVITGTFTLAQADELAKQILSGALGVRLMQLEFGQISPTLGARALMLCLIAGGIGLLLVMLYMCLYYKGLGLIACLSLFLYAGALLFLLAIMPWVQLSLPGIAGIILSFGIATDANIIIFERIRDEYRVGKSINASVAAGFKKSLWTVLDAEFTTLIAALILIILGQGAVAGFGITLFIGVLVSMFCSLVFTRSVLKLALRVNKTNNKFYGLNRPQEIEELPDAPVAPKTAKVKKLDIPSSEGALS